MMDQVTLDQLRAWPPGKVAAQPTEVLAALADNLAEMKAFVADAEARLNAGLDVRFGDHTRQLRAADGKDGGRVRFGDGLFVIVADIPKRIDWDQHKLAAVVARILIQADILAVRAGLMTLKEAIARQGYDPGHVLAEIGATNAELDALGIVLDTDPRKATKTGAAKAATGDEQA